MSEPDPEDRYKVLTGVINIASGVAGIMLLLLFLLEVWLPDNVNNAIKALVAAIFFACFVYRIVLWVNRPIERRNDTPTGLFAVLFPRLTAGVYPDINPVRFASIAVAVTVAVLAVLLSLRK